MCRKRNEEALQIAKKNVREKYLVIGIAEDLSNTVKAFEKLIPSVFTGANKIYNNKPSPQQFHVRKGNSEINSIQSRDILTDIVNYRGY